MSDPTSDPGTAGHGDRPGTPGDGLEQLDDQVERTLLAWRRTALALVAAGLLVAHLSGERAGPVLLAVAMIGLAAVVAFVWLGHDRLIGAAGLALVGGVLLLGAMALVGVAAH